MNKLDIILKEEGIAKSDATKLAEAFGAPFEEAGEVLAGFSIDDETGELVVSKDAVKVKDETDVEAMDLARTQRLILKKARTTIENNRKELKADIVKQGKAIDKIANLVKSSIIPAEQYLESQEKFAELAEAKRQAELKAKRVEQLMQFTDDISFYNLDDMSTEQFESLLATLKTQHEAKIQAEKEAEAKAEADRKAKEEADQKMREENERLKAEAEAKEKAEAEERAKREAEEKKAQEAQIAENQRISKIKVSLLEFAHNLKTVADCTQALEELDVAYQELEALDAENEVVSGAYHKSKAEIVEIKQFIIDRDNKAEADRKAQEEAKAQAEKEEAERKALLAPDKDKILKFGQAIELIRTEKLPAVKTKQAQDVVNEIDAILVRMKKFIDTSAESL